MKIYVSNPMFFLMFLVLVPFSVSQLYPTESRILLQIQSLLEYPPSLQTWTNWTNFCYLPPTVSLKIVCYNHHVTELTVVGNKTRTKLSSFSLSRNTLSPQFSIDTFFTVLTKLSSLKSLSLLSLGLWGPLSAKIQRLSLLEVLDLSSNFIYGEIPKEIGLMMSLKSLVLADNMFNGSVPDLQNLSNLKELDLSDNYVGPQFPSVTDSLVSLVLRQNSFRSEIPSGLARFNQLQNLDISSNSFVGSVPIFLFSIISVQNLSLGNNRFTGSVSNFSCYTKFKFLDISQNYLIGKLPSCFSSNNTVISSWNCLSSGNLRFQHPITFCQKKAFTVKPPAIKDLNKKKKSNIEQGLVIGIIVGVVGITGALALVVLVCMRRSEPKEDNGRDRKSERAVADRVSLSVSSKPPIGSRRVPQTLRSAVIGLPPYCVFTLEEIEDATKNFDPKNLVEEGSDGLVYKGRLREGKIVIVRCIKLKHKNLPQSVLQQIEVLSKLRHLHLVSVLGHCVVTYQDHPNSGTTVYVVQEHISNGTLREHLTDQRKREYLKWPQRMSLTIGIARGIQFLHSGVSVGIFGNSLNTKNIMLDDCLTAKISGYKIPLSSKVGGDSPLQGHDIADPASNKNAEKEDVYQFGVILLEIITGTPITSPSELEELKLLLETSLAEGGSKLRSIIDPSVRGSYAYESVRTAVEFTINCLCKDPNSRPSIEDVVWNLQYTIQVQEGWNSSGNLGTQM